MLLEYLILVHRDNTFPSIKSFALIDHLKRLRWCRKWIHYAHSIVGWIREIRARSNCRWHIVEVNSTLTAHTLKCGSSHIVFTFFLDIVLLYLKEKFKGAVFSNEGNSNKIHHKLLELLFQFFYIETLIWVTQYPLIRHIKQGVCGKLVIKILKELSKLD